MVEFDIFIANMCLAFYRTQLEKLKTFPTKDAINLLIIKLTLPRKDTDQYCLERYIRDQ